MLDVLEKEREEEEGNLRIAFSCVIGPVSSSSFSFKLFLCCQHVFMLSEGR